MEEGGAGAPMEQIPVVVKSAIGFSWYSWAVKDDLLFDELASANLNYLAFTTTGVWFSFQTIMLQFFEIRKQKGQESV